MVICRLILLFFFLFIPNTLSAENSLKSTKISTVDLLILKYDLYIEKIKPRVLAKTKKGFMVHYDRIEQQINFDENDNINIIISAYMSIHRYTKVKKYIPKLTDCNIIRNRMITNKNGYSLITNKKNYSVSEEILFDEIKKNVFNLKNFSDKAIEESLENTNVKINIIHPLSKFDLSCSGKITQLELD